MKAPKETELVKACLELLKMRGAFAWRQNSGAVTGEYAGKKRFVRFNGAPGCADIIGVLNGNLIAVEAKMPGKEPTEKQQAFLDEVRRHGGAAFVVHSIKELEEALEGLNA